MQERPVAVLSSSIVILLFWFRSLVTWFKCFSWHRGRPGLQLSVLGVSRFPDLNRLNHIQTCVRPRAWAPKTSCNFLHICTTPSPVFCKNLMVACCSRRRARGAKATLEESCSALLWSRRTAAHVCTQSVLSVLGRVRQCDLALSLFKAGHQGVLQKNFRKNPNNLTPGKSQKNGQE